MTPTDESSRDDSLTTRGAEPFVFLVHGGGVLIGDRKMGALMGRTRASRGGAVVSAGHRLAPSSSLDVQRVDVGVALAVYRGAGHGFDDRRLLSTHHAADSFRRSERFMRTRVHADEASSPDAAPMTPDVGLG